MTTNPTPNTDKEPRLVVERDVDAYFASLCEQAAATEETHTSTDENFGAWLEADAFDAESFGAWLESDAFNAE